MIEKKIENMEMVERNQKVLPKLKKGNCFACGSANPIGLNLDFYREGQHVYTRVILDKHHKGWQNMAHGGIVSTLLDEVMSWAVLSLKKAFFVTRKMEIKYIKPVLIGIPLAVKGHIIEGIRAPFIEAQGEILNEDDHVLARGHARFVEVPREKLTEVPEDMKEEMVLLMKKISNR